MDLWPRLSYPGLRLRSTLAGGSSIRHIAWSPDGAALAQGLEDSTSCIWEVEAGKVRLRTGRHAAPVIHVAWSPAGELLATSDQQALRVWPVAAPSPASTPFRAPVIEPSITIEVPSRSTPALTWSSSGCHLHLARILGARPGERLVIETWDTASGQLLASLTDPAWDRCYFGVSPDRCQMALALTSRDIQIWDLTALQLLGIVPGGHRRIRSLAASPDRRTVVIGFVDGALEVWDLLSAERLRLLTESERSVYSVAFSATGQTLAAKSRDGTVRIWRCAGWEGLAEINERSPSERQLEIAFSPSHPRLATYDHLDSAVRIWDLEEDDMPFPLASPIRILFAFADPFAGERGRLLLGQELQHIREELSLARLWDHFEVYPEPAVRADLISRTLLDYRPHIVHFSGHGNTTGALIAEDADGRPQPMTPRAVKGLFPLAAQDVRCVLLNACYSHTQAKAIAQRVPYVVGMRKAVADRAAIAFSVGFYRALGHGRSIAEAFSLGREQLDLLNLPDFRTPVLWKDKKRVSARDAS